LFRGLASEGRRRIGREGKKKIREKEENKIIFKRIFFKYILINFFFYENASCVVIAFPSNAPTE